MTPPSLFHQRLRALTASDHDIVDAAFGGFRLDARADYAHFLAAHARVLPDAERMLRPGELLPDWQGRSEALAHDLKALGVPMPPARDCPRVDGEAARWGMLYVMEGSRLGGVMLSRRVPEHFPKAYLSSRAAPGAWRSLQERLDTLALAEGEGFEFKAVAAARRMFAHYAEAAAWEPACV